MQKDEREQYITFAEAARQYPITESGVRNRAARGVIETKKFGYSRLVLRASLERALRRQQKSSVA